MSKIPEANLIVAIDGPAGSGKSTVGRGVAAALGFQFLDSGAVYRAATLAAMQAGIKLGDGTFSAKDALKAIDSCKLEMRWSKDEPVHVILNGKDVTDAIRTEEVTAKIRYIADLREIRELATTYMRQFTKGGRFVCDGRDQGTVVFPSAFLKIYLWASPGVRAKRRHTELIRKGENITVDQLEVRIRDRDRLDMSRELGALKKAIDAIEVDTTAMSPQQAIDAIVKLARERMG